MAPMAAATVNRASARLTQDDDRALGFQGLVHAVERPSARHVHELQATQIQHQPLGASLRDLLQALDQAGRAGDIQVSCQGDGAVSLSQATSTRSSGTRSRMAPNLRKDPWLAPEQGRHGVRGGGGKVITFTLPDSGQVTGFSFTTGTTVASITFTLNIGGRPATVSQLYLGGKPAHPKSGSPLTITR